MIPLEIPKDIRQQFELVEPKVIPVKEGEIENLLKEIKVAIKEGRCRIDNTREKNEKLTQYYVLDEKGKYDILKELKVTNFVRKELDTSRGSYKRKERGFPQEVVYIFTHKKELEIRGREGKIKEVKLYIKINNRTIPSKVVIVISFHEAGI